MTQRPAGRPEIQDPFAQSPRVIVVGVVLFVVAVVTAGIAAVASGVVVAARLGTLGAAATVAMVHPDRTAGEAEQTRRQDPISDTIGKCHGRSPGRQRGQRTTERDQPARHGDSA
jgi:hypothetical protein